MPELLLTGASGLIGRALQPALPQAGLLALSGRAEVDFCQREAVLALPAVQTVIHLAAASSTFAFEADPEAAWRTNLLSTLHLLEYIRQRSVRRLVLASTYVYGPPQYVPVDEAHPVSPHHAYQRSKWICEQLCTQYARDYGFELLILRLFNVYGPGQDARMLIPTILDQLSGQAVSLQDPVPSRDFIHVRDVARAFARAAVVPAQGIFNIGSGQSVSVEALVSQILRISGRHLPVYFTRQARPHEVNQVVADITRARTELDWEPQIALEEGLRELLCV